MASDVRVASRQIDTAIPGNHRDTRRLGQPARGELVAGRAHGGGRRADPGHAGSVDTLGETAVLGQVAVPGVDRVGLHRDGGFQDRVGVQKRRDGGRHVGQPHVLFALLAGEMQGGDLDPQLTARPGHTDGDLAAICDQKSVDRTTHPGWVFSRKAASPS